MLRKSRPLLYTPKIRIINQSRKAQTKQKMKCLDVYIAIQTGARITEAQARAQINRANNIWKSANIRFNLIRIKTDYNGIYNNIRITYPPEKDLLQAYWFLRDELNVKPDQVLVIFSSRFIQGTTSPIDPTAFAFIRVVENDNRTIRYPSVFVDNTLDAGENPNVLAHELGHILFANPDGSPPESQPSKGIPHSLNRSNVMYPFALYGTVNTNPEQRALAYQSDLLRLC